MTAVKATHHHEPPRKRRTATTVPRFKRVLIANRGEIAVRVARTLREMGIEPVALYSEVDRTAPHVRAADLAFFIGPPPARESYLRGDAIIDIAKAARVDAIHPGYGFLSENAGFAAAVAAAGMTFIGPPPEAMRVMGSKTGARAAMQAAGVPCVPGSGPVETDGEARQAAQTLGYPVLLKASAGGGGKGMRMVHHDEEMAGALRSARSEAKNAFGDDTVYLEKAIVNPRHIEMQIFAGPDGRAIYLGERECSMQRRHQKVIEETPSLVVDDAMRQKMGEVACRAADSVGYVGAGTIEFLVDAERNFYFLEMNTRLQVEHAVTELVCGLDLVELQVRVAEGHPLSLAQDAIERRGHAIEARIYAEDPARNFVPSPGHIVELVLAQGPGVRVDCGVSAGLDVSPHYDPMIAKVCAWGVDRDHARRRLVRALGETAIKGVTTNNTFLRNLLNSDAFTTGHYHTGTVGDVLAALPAAPPPDILQVGIAAAVINTFRRDVRSQQKVGGRERAGLGGWRSAGWRSGGG